MIRAEVKLTISRWILTELSRTVREVTAGIEKLSLQRGIGCRIPVCVEPVLRLVPGTPETGLNGEDEAAQKEAQGCAAYVLDEVYKLLHPFMPFITEELWDQTRAAKVFFVMLRGRRPAITMKRQPTKSTGWWN